MVQKLFQVPDGQYSLKLAVALLARDNSTRPHFFVGYARVKPELFEMEVPVHIPTQVQLQEGLEEQPSILLSCLSVLPSP